MWSKKFFLTVGVCASWCLPALCSVVEVSPPPESCAAVTSQVSMACSPPLQPVTVSTNTFRVHAGQWGWCKGTASLSDGNQTATFVPDRNFRPGERVAASATAGMRDTLGAAVQYGWQFDVSPPERGVDLRPDIMGPNLSGFLCLAGDIDHDGSNDVVDVRANGFAALRHAGTSWAGPLTSVPSLTGAALGDMDGDGDLDLVTISAGGTNHWWLNDGAGGYTVSSCDLGTNVSRCVAVADFDSDGDLDVFIGGDGTNQLWMNGGAGVFAQAPVSFGPQGARYARAADFNGDGWCDIALIDSGGLNVWLNDGACSFVHDTQDTALTQPSSLDVGDLDCDGYPDLLILSSNGNNRIWLNDGAGRFAESGADVGSNSLNAVLADMDGDGDLDALISRGTSPRACLFISLGDGTFRSTEVAKSLAGTSSSSSCCVTDCNNDGRLDVLACPNTSRFTLYINQAAGVDVRVAGGAVVPDGAPAESQYGTARGAVEVGDYSVGEWFKVSNAVPNAAEIVDVRVGGGGASHFLVNLATGRIPSTGAVMTVAFAPLLPGWHTARVEIVSNATNSPYVVNFVGEGIKPFREVTNTTPRAGCVDFAGGTVIARLVLAVEPATVTTNTFFLHSAARGVIRGTIAVSPDGRSVSLVPDKVLLPGEEVEVVLTTGIKYAGCNDGLSGFSWKFRVAVASGGGFFRRWGRVGIGSSAVGVPRCVDVDGDGDLDLLMSGEYLRNDGNLAFVPGSSFDPSAYPWDSGDLDCDGDIDVSFFRYSGVVGAISYGYWEVWRNDGNGFSRVSQVMESFGSPHLGLHNVKIGDINGDGHRDAFLQDWVGYYMMSWPITGQLLNSGDGVDWTPIDGLVVPGECSDYGLADLDGDGMLDIYAAFGGGDGVYLNDGTGQFFDPGWRFGTDTSERVYLWDLNGDGRADALAAGDSGARCWTNRGDGMFFDCGQNLGAGKYWALGDVDGDGDIDLVGDSSANGIGVFLNSNGVFVSAGLIPDTAGLTPSALADMDGDGDLDVVAGTTILLNEPAAQVFATNGLWVPSGTEPAKGNGTLFRLAWDAETATTNRFAITNAGLASVDILGVATNGSGAAYFEVTIASKTVAGLQSAAFDVAFRPTGEGVFTAVVSFVFSSCSSPYTLNLKGVSGMLSVTDVAPPANEQGVDTGSVVRAWFNKTLDADSVNVSSVALTSDRGTSLAGAVQVIGAWNEVVCVPGRGLMAGETVRATVTSKVVEQGNGVECTPYGWSFTAKAGGNQRLAHDGRTALTGLGRPVVGDVDGDGDVDAILGSTLFTNDGAGRLTMATTFPGVVVAMGDVNGDRARDIVLLSNGQQPMVYTNNGNGTFSTHGCQLGREAASDLVLGDMDNDGDLDAVAIGSQGVSVWINDGHGRFDVPRRASGAGSPSNPVLVDVDGDGDLDVAVTSGGSGIRFLLNDGEGMPMMGEAVVPVGAVFVVGDVDGNGSPDVVGTNAVWLNNGQGVFHIHPSGFTGGVPGGEPHPYGLTMDLGDLDGDGDLDLVVPGSGFGARGSRIWINDGTGGFASSGWPVDWFLNTVGYAVKLADLDGDGDLDALVSCTSPYSSGTGGFVWLNELSRISLFGRNLEEVPSGSAPSGPAGTEFGSVGYGQVLTNTLCITNCSRACVVLTGVATGGLSTTFFSLRGPPGRLGPSASTNIEVVFIGARGGSHSAWMDILSDATNTPYRINLAATVTNYVVNAMAGPHGTVTPAGAVSVPSGLSTSFVVSADAYYHIQNVSTDGMTCASGGAVRTAVWDRVDIGGTLSATFAENLATNGVPEWWLAGYGWTTNFDAAALSDSDCDGAPAWCEFIAGTSPTANGSVLAVTPGATPDGAPFVLRWPSVAGRTYTAEWCSNLTSGVFSPFADGIDLPANPPENVYTNETVTNLPSLFYRIRVRKTGP